MKKAITITAPPGKVINFNEENGTIIFDDEPKPVFDRIKTFQDVLKELKIDSSDFLKGLEGLSSDEVAYRRLKLIIKAFNEGWTPDWTNSNERKYYPWFVMDSSSGVGLSYHDYVLWHTFSFAGSRLCFKSSDLAEHVGKLFIDDYSDFLTLNID